MKTVNKNRKSTIKKRYCEHCDGINSGGFYDDICMVQEIDELCNKYFFECKNKKTGEWESGCQVPAKVRKELEDLYCGGFGSCNYGGFTICDALAKQRELEQQCQPLEPEIAEMSETIQEDNQIETARS